MIFTRVLMLTVVFVGGAGCATTSPKDAPKVRAAATTDANALPAQELANGACGIFFWSMTSPKHFVFFQKEGANTAEFFFDARAQKLRAEQVTSGLEDSYGVNLSYTGPSTEKITVKGVYSEVLDGGRRISDAAIIIGKDDGWQEIMPVSGLYACR